MSSENQQFSNKLFYKTYLTLVTFIILIGTTLEFFIDSTDNNLLSNQISKLSKSSLVLIQNKLTQTNEEDWQKTLNKLSNQLDVKLAYYKVKDFFSGSIQREKLQSGKILTLFGNDNTISSYIQINKTDYLIELELTALQQRNNSQWIPIVFYLLIALIVFLLIKPFANQLLKLKSAANQIAKGNFNTRIDMLESSNLFPIADAFDTMTSEIESLLIRQRDLTNAVSHELRTPLTRLKFAFEEIEAHIHNNQLILYINNMRGDVTELEKLIDEMLLYAEATQIKECELNKIEIKTFINDLVSSTNTQQFLVKVKTKFSDNICQYSSLYGNRPRLFRALSNILRNSISYAHSECILELELLPDTLTILIIDDGPGIPLEFIDRVFDPFVKIASKKRKNGYGLGLAIAKTIINNHEGTIGVVNRKPNGAIFSIILQLS